MPGRSLRLTLLVSAALIVIASLYAYGNLRTPPVVLAPGTDDAKNIAFLSFGDWGTGNFAQRKVASALETVAGRRPAINFTVLLGDNFYTDGVDSVDDRQWTNHFESIYDGPHLLGMPFYAVLGNHDIRGNTQAEIRYDRLNKGTDRWRMPKHQYVEDFGMSHAQPLIRIVFIDTNAHGKHAKRQATKIRAAFTAGPDKPVWRIVAGHHPVRNYGHHGEKRRLKNWLLPALKDARVDLYLSGHEHNQQIIAKPGEPLYAISGGGGDEVKPITHRDKQLLFGAVQFGFIRITADAKTLGITVYNDSATRIYQTQLQRPCAKKMPGCLTTTPAP